MYTMKVGHKKDQFFLYKGFWIIAVYYNIDKCKRALASKMALTTTTLEDIAQEIRNEKNTKENGLD